MQQKATSTTLCLFSTTTRILYQISEDLEKALSDDYEVMDWTLLNSELVDMIEADRVEGYVFMFILYMVISFGIFGTVLMMLAERRKEFGVLIAIGMKRIQLAVLVWLEVMLISILGSFLGMFGAFPICYYMHANPIAIEGEITPKYFTICFLGF